MVPQGGAHPLKPSHDPSMWRDRGRDVIRQGSHPALSPYTSHPRPLQLSVPTLSYITPLPLPITPSHLPLLIYTVRGGPFLLPQVIFMAVGGPNVQSCAVRPVGLHCNDHFNSDWVRPASDCLARAREKRHLLIMLIRVN